MDAVFSFFGYSSEGYTRIEDENGIPLRDTIGSSNRNVTNTRFSGTKPTSSTPLANTTQVNYEGVLPTSEIGSRFGWETISDEGEAPGAMSSFTNIQDGVDNNELGELQKWNSYIEASPEQGGLKQLLNDTSLEDHRFIVQELVQSPQITRRVIGQRSSSVPSTPSNNFDTRWRLISPRGAFGSYYKIALPDNSVSSHAQRVRENAIRGNMKLHEMIAQTWDPHALRRFEKQFGWRYYRERPLTVGQLKQFIAEEEMWRSDCYPIHHFLTLSDSASNASNSLLHLVKKVDSLLKAMTWDEKQKKVIGVLPNNNFSPSYFKPQWKQALALSSKQWGSLEAARHDAIRQGVVELRVALEDALSVSFQRYKGAKEHILYLFDHELEHRAYHANAMTLLEFHNFLTDALEIERLTKSLFSSWAPHVNTFVTKLNEGLDLETTHMQNSLDYLADSVKSLYNYLGRAAAGVIIYNAIKSSNDPVTVIVKALSTSVIVGYENTPERIMSAAIIYAENGLQLPSPNRNILIDCIKAF